MKHFIMVLVKRECVSKSSKYWWNDKEWLEPCVTPSSIMVSKYLYSGRVI